MTTPAMRICTVSSGEDFTALLTTDQNMATLDVEVVTCGARSDARVKLVLTEALADEFVIV